MYGRLSRMCLTECNSTASNHMNVYIVSVWGVSLSSLVQPERRRQGVWEMAGTPATPIEMLRGLFTSSRQILLRYLQKAAATSFTMLSVSLFANYPSKKAMPHTHSVVQKMGRGVPVIA